MEKLKSYFMFNKQQRSGILFLFSIIFLLQAFIFFSNSKSSTKVSKEEKKWLSNQAKLDSLKELKQQNYDKLYPFNPNFITSYKGYKLGMTIEQIKKLHDFRAQNKYVNSANEFQQLTGVHDTLLNKIAPYFKFPDWVTNKKTSNENKYIENKTYQKFETPKKEIKIIDINLATKEDLMAVYGIGEAISDRILKQKEVFGAFVSMEQMNDVWGLSPEVIDKLNEKFNVINQPSIKKIKINEASIKELGAFPYFRYPISKNIVVHRTMNGDIKIEDLTKIKDFPVDKIKIIALYLEF